MNKKLLKRFIFESLVSANYLKHVQNGLGYCRNNQNLEAQQIVSDWLEEIELRSYNLLSPSHVFRIEQFVSKQWPIILEQFRGDKYRALLVMNNMINAKYNDLR